MIKEFEKYFNELQSVSLDDITEHTHRPALRELLVKIATSDNKKKIQIIHEEKRSKEGFGAPDFTIKSTEAIIGYVENKKIEEDISKTLKSDQIKKYKKLSDNILITNYCDWIWIKGDNIQKASLFDKDDLADKKFKLDPANVQQVQSIIEYFLSEPPRKLGKSKLLAEALAVRARNLKEFLYEDIELTVKQNTQGRIYGLYNTFKENISHEITTEEFSDTFGQMIAYSLFLARLNAGNKTITLRNAKDFIPASYDLIRELVDFIEDLQKIDEYKNTRWIIQEILSIVNYIDLEAILLDLSFIRQTELLDDDEKELFKKDPYIYFYEDFLKAYDASIRQRRGVYYTPPPVVSFITRAINDILKNDFGIEEGFADREQITVLDFATGTGTFLRDIIALILEDLPPKSGKKDLIIKDHILKNLYGFEYLIAPYTIAHIKLSQFLREKEYKLKDDERFEIYLTNTLEPLNPQINFLLPALTKESQEAQKIKDKKILVITGNPPYSGHSQNPSEKYIEENGKRKKVKTWIGELIQDYYTVDGQPLGERNPKWLQDDYVKFIRFAQNKISQTGEGVIGIITNHSFLDNPTFRGMRRSLMNTFDRIYFIDLHGNTKKNEKCPDGSKDDNVFDIEQGVCISLFVKKEGLKKGIYHTSFWGKRNEKYRQCYENSIKSIDWVELEPDQPFYLFIPQNTELREQYQKNFAIKEIFELNNVGIVTANDKILVSYNEIDLKKKVEEHYQINFNPKITEPVSYRPFDKRFLYYDTKIIERARFNIMNQFINKNNIGIYTCRQTITNLWQHVFITKNIIDDCCISNKTKERGYIFPLYFYETEEEYKQRTNKAGGQMGLFATAEPYQPKRENFKPEFRTFINNKYGKEYTPEQILGYIYAVMHCPAYREKYLEFLKIDFPRVPFVDDAAMFEKLSELGFELVQKHLLEGVKPAHRYTGKGDDLVEKSGNKNDPFWINGKLYINKTQFFDNVPEEVFNFQIGGYNVIEHYLKDRKGRKLSYDEIENIEKVVQVISFTIDQMQKIDELAKGWI